MVDDDPKATVEAYLQVYDRRDMTGCLDFFTEDAVVNFANGIYRGRRDLEGWHNERFKADLRMIRIDRITVNGDTVVVDALATSKVARAWKLPKVAGRATFICHQGKIQEITFGLRSVLPLEAW